jgi:aldehyde dehydrogenase (NAD+)
MKAITPHYIDGKFIEPHGREVMDSINPTNNNVIGSVTLADEEDAERAIAAAKRAVASFGGASKEERAAVLRRLKEVVTARIHDLTAAMVEEYRGVHDFSKLIVQMAADSFFHAEKALQEPALVRTWNKTTVCLTPVGVTGLITPWNSNALFICLKTASALAAGCTVVVKPSELSSFQTQVLLECVHEAKLPRSVLML